MDRELCSELIECLFVGFDPRVDHTLLFGQVKMSVAITPRQVRPAFIQEDLWLMAG